MKRSPLRSRRDRPRRNEGRVQHKRVKVVATDKGMEDRHVKRVRALPCLVCGQPSTAHHVTASIHGGRMSRSDQRVVPLCPKHHQKVFDPSAANPVSVEGLGHAGFYRLHGVDLLEEARRLWRETNEEEG